MTAFYQRGVHLCPKSLSVRQFITGILIVHALFSISCVTSRTENSSNQPLSPVVIPKQPLQFTKITKGLIVSENATVPGTYVPFGSTLYHWANGITELYGPDNKLIFIAKDSECAVQYGPGGERPVTYGVQVPNGAVISTNKDDKNIMTVSLHGQIILTIIKKTQDYLY